MCYTLCTQCKQIRSGVRRVMQTWSRQSNELNLNHSFHRADAPHPHVPHRYAHPRTWNLASPQAGAASGYK